MLWHEYHGLYTSVNQNKNNFSICLKVPNVTAGSRTAAGRAFQDAGPEVLKAHGPRVTVHVCGMSSWWSSDDCSRGRPWTIATRTQRRSSSPVPNGEDIYTSTGTTCRFVGDPLWKVEPVQRASAVIRSQILVMVNNTKYEVSILSRSMDIEVSQNIHIID